MATKTTEPLKPLALQPKAVRRQVLMVILADLTLLTPGMGLGYPAVTLHQLQDETESFHMSEDESTWFASVNSLATPIGGLLCAYVLDKLGRKPTFYLISIVAIVAWLLVGSADYDDHTANYAQIIVGRILVGIAMGLCSSPVSVYSAEICHPKIRGRLSLGSTVGSASGIFIIYALGYIFRDNWQLLARIACGISVLPLLATLKIPESPSWLMVNGRLEESKISLKYFRGLSMKEIVNNPEFEQEFKNLQLALEMGEHEHMPKFWESFRQPEVYKPLFIMIGFFACQQFSGLFVMVVYAARIAVSAGAKMDPILCAMLMGFVRLPTMFVFGFVLDSIGRRLPAIWSTIGMSICMLLLAIAIQYSEVSADLQLPVILLAAYIVISVFGLNTLPFVMIGEVFPQRVRGRAASITISANYTMSFLNVQFYPPMASAIGAHNMFLFYGVTSMLCALYIYLFLPETKGRTLFEISDSFKKKRSINP